MCTPWPAGLLLLLLLPDRARLPGVALQAKVSQLEAQLAAGPS